MKYYKLINGIGYPSLKVGKIYREDYRANGACKVFEMVEFFPADWELVKTPKPKKSLSEKIEKLKKQAESEGMKLEVVLEKVDPWEGVEFVDRRLSKCDWNICRISHYEGNSVWYFNKIGKQGFRSKNELTPSTQSAYEEQLKRIAFEKFGEINEGDRFDQTPINEVWGISKIEKHQNTLDYSYTKEIDSFCFGNLVIYKQGKWAERVNERIEVSPNLKSIVDALEKVAEKNQESFLNWVASKRRILE